MSADRNKVKVWFTGFDYKDSNHNPYLYKLLAKRNNIELTEDCDFLFVDYKDYVYHKTYLKHDCVRILHSSENISPDYCLIDYALCPNFLPNEDRFLWVPYYWWSTECWDLIGSNNNVDWANREGFCCFVVSNSNAEPMRSAPSTSMREYFYDALSKFKKIDSPGRFKQNMPLIQVDPKSGKSFYSAKIDFMEKYRFALTFENSRAPGYTTEKLVHALIAGCIPIYWGDPMVNTQFDERCFIWVKDENDVDRAIEEIRKIEANPALAKRYFMASSKYLKTFESICRTEYVTDFLDNILSKGKKEAQRRSRYYLSTNYEKGILKGVSFDTEAAPNGLKDVDMNIPMSAFIGHSPNVIPRNKGELLQVQISEDYKGYIQTYGGRFKSPPPPQYREKAAIPSNTHSISVAFDYSSNVPVQIAVYILQYNCDKQVRDDFKESTQKTSGTFKMESRVAEDAQTYKLAIRLTRPDKVAEQFEVEVSGLKACFRVPGH